MFDTNVVDHEIDPCSGIWVGQHVYQWTVVSMDLHFKNQTLCVGLEKNMLSSFYQMVMANNHTLANH